MAGAQVAAVTEVQGHEGGFGWNAGQKERAGNLLHLQFPAPQRNLSAPAFKLFYGNSAGGSLAQGVRMIN